MLIKLLSRMAGPEGNYPPGTVIEVENEIGMQLINGGHAEDITPIIIEHQKEPEKEPEKEEKEVVIEEKKKIKVEKAIKNSNKKR